MTRINEDEFGELLAGFDRTAFRLETRAQYALDYEAPDFELFLAGNPRPPDQLEWWRPWLDQIARLTREGKRIGRVRIVEEPPSDYQRWELWAADYHARAGERIAYMPRSRAEAIGLPIDHDWWLLDDMRVIVMRHTPTGENLEKILITDREIVARYCGWRDLAVSHATPAARIAVA